MKIKLLGYNIVGENFPPALRRTDIYEHISKSNGLQIGKTFAVGASLVSVPAATGKELWWGGMVLRIRDAKAFNKIKSQDGKVTLTAEKLEANEKLAEVSFFIAHPTTGNGLFSQYTGSASLKGFEFGLARVFRYYLRATRDAALEQADKAERKAIRERHTGYLEIGQLCQTKDLKTLVSSLARLKTCELKLTTVVTKERLFRPIAQYAETEAIRFILSDDVDPADFGEAVETVAASQKVESLAVRGVDAKGQSHVYRAAENALSFGEFDYDSLMGDIQLDLSDWAASIKSSPIVQKLAATAAGSQVHALLSKT